jgi:hypothetical protein
MRLQVLTTTCLNLAVFWIVALCSLVDIDDVSKGLTASIISVFIALMEAVSFSETLV